MYLPDFIPACRSVTVASSNSKGFTGTGDGDWIRTEVRANAVPPASRLACKNVLRSMSCCSVGQQPFGFARQVVHLRQDRVLQLRMISDPGIERANAAHRRVQLVEEFIGDARGDLRAIAPRKWYLRAPRSRGWFFRRTRGWPPNRRAPGCAGR